MNWVDNTMNIWVTKVVNHIALFVGIKERGIKKRLLTKAAFQTQQQIQTDSWSLAADLLSVNASSC